MDSYDYGFVTAPENGKGTKVTVNKFRGQWYIHIREYLEDGDTGTWFPTKKGIAIKAEYVDLLAYILTDIGSLLTSIYYEEISDIIVSKQLNLFEDIEREH